MKLAEFTKFLRENIEPLKDANRGERYRAAAHWNDGTYLHCAVFEGSQAWMELTLRRFKRVRWKRAQHRMVVESVVAGGLTSGRV